MILFWVLCAGLLIVALAFILPTLLEKNTNANDSSDQERKEANIAVYRDQLAELKHDLENGIVSQEQFNQDSQEIQRRLLEDISTSNTTTVKATPANRNTAYVLALAIPLIAVVFYLKVGTTNAITSVATSAPEAGPMAGGAGPRTQAQIDANVQKLADRLKANPSDPAGWIMLARSYSSMERYAEAAGAYAKATELNPNDADLWAEYAFVSAMASDRKLEGKPTELIQHALKIDPGNAKALQLAGTAAFDAKDYKKAIEIWQKVLSKVPPGSDVAQAIADRITEAKKLAGN